MSGPLAATDSVADCPATTEVSLGCTLMLGSGAGLSLQAPSRVMRASRQASHQGVDWAFRMVSCSGLRRPSGGWSGL